MSRQVKNTQLQLQQLSVDQLRSLKETMDNDIGSLSRAYDSIRVARNRFADGKTYLETFKAYKPEQEMLVPLSSSLYVPTSTSTLDASTWGRGTTSSSPCPARRNSSGSACST
jgi:prefoldin alpha subunit